MKNVFATVVSLLFLSAGNAFTFTVHNKATSSLKSLANTNEGEKGSSSSFAPINFNDKKKTTAIASLATFAAIATTSPLAAIAEEVLDADGEYEYGAVDAPPIIPIVGGLLAILTAAVPVVMQGGEEAFNEMRDRDSDKWGSGNTNRLDGRK